MNPKISVIMPAFNTEPYIAEAIGSVLHQTFRDFELLILNDGSTDGTGEIIRQFAAADGRVKVLENRTPAGTAHARKQLIEQASGEQIAFLDSDDVWREDKLECQYKVLDDNPETGLCFTACGFMNEAGKKSSFVFHVPENPGYHDLLMQNVIPCSSVLCRKKFLKGVSEDESLHEDYITWLFTIRETAARGIDIPLVTYRIRRNSRSRNRWRALWMTYRCYRKAGFSVLPALIYLVCNAVNTVRTKYSNIRDI